MNLLDDSTARNLESSIETMTPSNHSHSGGSAVVDAPEHAQPSQIEQTQVEQISASHSQHPESEHTESQHTSQHDAGQQDSAHNDENSAHDNNSAGSDDFATALQDFETESEEAVGEDHVIKGRVVKLTATHVVVDIGAKSEGMAPLSEILDHENKPKFKPGDDIDVMRDKGETEEGY